jgi:signal transduction histidine kinase
MSLRPRLKKTQHTVTVNCPEHIELDSYPGAFSQILTNLVMNSLIHGFEEIEQGEIVIDVSQNEHTLLVTYSDNGKGVEQEHLTRIFEPFFTTGRGRAGSGLGLHIIYNVVTQTLGGQIHCTSTPGENTTFTITVPLHKDKGNG